MPTSFPNPIKVAKIDAKCDDWNAFHRAWQMMSLLYEGGVAIENFAQQFLTRRPKEVADVFQSRIERFSYQNHVGSATDWYLAAIFEKPPQVELEVESEPVVDSTEPPEPIPSPSAVDDFYADFEKNCDRAGTPILEAYRDYFKNLLVFGRAATLVDLPARADYATAAEQQDAKALDPYLCSYDPPSIINYARDAQGALMWIIFSTRSSNQIEPLADPEVADHWYIFTQEEYATYKRVIPADEKKTPDDAEATLVDAGRHALAEFKRVPVVYRELPRGLWLMNRAFSVAKDHVNTDNALGWALFMAALCMPVIKSDVDFKPTMSEASFIQLPENASFGWTEPEGKSFIHLAARTQTLKEEIFRSFYLIAQARTTSATPAAQSGISKQEDMAAPKKVLNVYGDVMRSVIEEMYNCVSLAKGDGNTWDVRGLEFPDGPPDDVVDTVEGAFALDIPSVTLEHELYKKAAVSLIPDANKALLDKVLAEIDAAPSKADREQQALQSRVDMQVAASAFPGKVI